MFEGNTSNKFLQLPNRTLHVYNAHDAYETARLWFTLSEAADSIGNLSYYNDTVEPLQDAVLAMQAKGLLVDREALKQYRIDTAAELHDTDEAILTSADAHNFTYNDKFLNSNKQLADFLYGTLGLKCHKRTEGGAPSVDLDALTRTLRGLRKKDSQAVPTLHRLFHRSRLQTIRERYLYFPTESEDDGRHVCRPSVKITGTKTFRYAYADPALQQWPPEARHFFTAREGHVYVQADYSQLEARILAILSGDPGSLGAFAAGDDVHAQNARDLFDIDLPKWESMGAGSKPYRNAAKTFLYRISYGGEGVTDKEKLFCPCPRCEDKVPATVKQTRNQVLAAEQRWFAKHQAVRDWQTELLEGIKNRRYYQSPFGVRRYVAKPWGPELEREGKNLPMQLNGACLMNQRQVRLHAAGAPIVLQHHDSFVNEVPEDEVPKWVDLIRDTMQEPAPELDNQTIPVDIKIGRNWGDQSDTNPEGLREIG